MRMTLATCGLLVLAGFARAHFIWLTPQHDKNAALMIFSDSLEPDGNVPIVKIAAFVQTGDPKPAEDPAATKLLADARAARAVWKGFGGFKADVAVNHNGVAHKGAVEVSATGKVALKLDAGEELQKWTRREITSLVTHRMPAAESLKTPCAFLDPKDEQHPLGRAVRVLNDELHSSYRIRDRQIIEVNRTGNEGRFTITVLESQLTKDKQFLPISYVFDSWDPKSGNLVSAVAEHLTWQYVGGFDMPATLLIVRTSASGRDSRLITFSNVVVSPSR